MESSLTPKQRRFVEAKLDGKSNTEAAIIATGLTNRRSAAVVGHRLLTHVKVQATLTGLMDAHGITAELLVQRLAEGLSATKPSVGKQEVLDYDTRLKALNLALELKGLL